MTPHQSWSLFLLLLLLLSNDTFESVVLAQVMLAAQSCQARVQLCRQSVELTLLLFSNGSIVDLCSS